MRANDKLLCERQDDLLHEMDMALSADEIKRLQRELAGIQCVMRPEDIMPETNGIYEKIYGYEGGEDDFAEVMGRRREGSTR